MNKLTDDQVASVTRNLAAAGDVIDRYSRILETCQPMTPAQWALMSDALDELQQSVDDIASAASLLSP